MEKINYQLITDKIIEECCKTKREKLLLHACCAPCATYVLEYLTKYFDITVFFSNSNITDKSEYEFAKLAEQYSTDSASTSSGSNDSFGGLYESVTLGQMVPDFEKWSIDDSRKYGDTGIVKSDYGYHIMFFINDCPEYQSKIIAQIKSDRLSNMIDKAEVKVHENAIKKAVEKEKAAKEAAAESATASPSNSAQATTSASSGNN